MVSLVCRVMEEKDVLFSFVLIKSASLNAKIFANLGVKKSAKYLAPI